MAQWFNRFEGQIIVMSRTQFNNSICFDPERLEEAISQKPNAYDIIWNILFSQDHLQHKYPVSCQCALISDFYISQGKYLGQGWI